MPKNKKNGMKGFWDMFKIDFYAQNELKSQNQAQYRLDLKTRHASNTLRYITTMLKIKKNPKNGSQDMNKMVKIWPFDPKITLSKGQNWKLLVSILIFYGLLLSCRKSKKIVKTVLKMWLKLWKFDLLILRHLQTGFFGILPYGSFWRPRLLLNSSRK